MSSADQYRESSPAACTSGVTCAECQDEVVKIAFSPDGSSVGVCRCRWTAWFFEADGKVYRSTPRGYK